MKKIGIKKKKKKGFSLLEQYSQGWDYILDSKNFIFIVIGIFFSLFLVGFLLPAPNFVVDYIRAFVEELLEKTQGMSNFELISFIFWNNTKSGFIGLILGIFFGIFPIFQSIFNGYIVGFVSSFAVYERGFSSLLRLLPHGIFELPAIFISLGLGVKLGTFIFQKHKLKSFKEYFLNSLRVFLLIVVPLLIIAAIIEGTLITFF